MCRQDSCAVSELTEGSRQLRMNNVLRNGELDWGKVVRVPHDYTDMDRYYLRAGDVLFNHTNSAELVGKSAVFFDWSESVVFSNHFFRLSPADDVLDRTYLALWLRLGQVSGLFTAICNRWVGQAAVSRKNLLNLPLSLPSLDEQRRVVARVEEQIAAANRAREAATAQLAAIEAMPAALLRESFPPSPAARLPRGWRWVKIGDVCAINPRRPRDLEIDPDSGSHIHPTGRRRRNFGGHCRSYGSSLPGGSTGLARTLSMAT